MRVRFGGYGLSIDGGDQLEPSIAAAVITAHLIRNAGSDDVVFDHLPEPALRIALQAVTAGACDGLCVVHITQSGVHQIDVQPPIWVRRHCMRFDGATCARVSQLPKKMPR